MPTPAPATSTGGGSSGGGDSGGDANSVSHDDGAQHLSNPGGDNVPATAAPATAAGHLATSVEEQESATPAASLATENGVTSDQQTTTSGATATAGFGGGGEATLLWRQELNLQVRCALLLHT